MIVCLLPVSVFFSFNVTNKEFLNPRSNGGLNFLRSVILPYLIRIYTEQKTF
jgi:hypothetical protein